MSFVVPCCICNEPLVGVRSLKACYCPLCKQVVATAMKREWHLRKRLGLVKASVCVSKDGV